MTGENAHATRKRTDKRRTKPFLVWNGLSVVGFSVVSVLALSTRSIVLGNDQTQFEGGGATGEGSGLRARSTADCETIPFGDVNGNGAADLDDILCLLNAFGGRFDNCPFAAADVMPCGEGDGTIDISDLNALIDTFANSPPCPRVCRPCVNNQGPLAQAGSDREAEPDQSLTFNGADSTDSDGYVIAYDWDFGDGSRAWGPTANHAYANGGTYTVTLAVTDSCNSVDYDQITVTVDQASCGPNNRLPVAEIGNDQSGSVGEAILFDGLDSYDPDGSVTECWWNFGDGMTTGWQSAAVMQHVYNQAGAYEAKLWVKDNCGGVSPADIVVVSVTSGSCGSNTKPVSRPGASQSSIVGELVVFDGEGSSDADGWIQSYSWSFGDGSMGSGSSVEHTYNSAGMHTVTLTVTDNCGSTHAGSTTVDVSASSFVHLDPSLIGFVKDNVGTVQGVAVSPDGWSLYVASKEFGVLEYGLEDPADPIYRLTSNAFFNAQGISVSESFMLTGGSSSGAKSLLLEDFASNNEPWHSLGFVAQDIALWGDIACVAAGASGFKVVDLGNPDGPRTTKSLSMFGRGAAISSDGQWAYAAAGSVSGTGQFHIIRIDSPDSASIWGTVSLSGGGNASDVVLSANGQYAYVANFNGGISVVDVSNSSQPREITSTGNLGGPASKIARSGDLLAVALSGSAPVLKMVDASNPTDLQVLGSYGGMYSQIAMSGDYVYAAVGTTGLVVFDVSNPEQIRHVKTVSSDMSNRTRSASNGLLAVVGGSTGFTRVLNVSDRNDPVLLGSIASVAQGIALDESGSRVYLAAGASGFRVVDLSDPSYPVIRHTVPMFARSVALSPDGGYAYVAAGTGGGLQVLDITGDPEVIGSVDTPGNASGVALSADGNIAYVADYSSGLQIIDIADPYSPQWVASIDTSGPASQVHVNNNIILVAESGASPVLNVFEAATPTDLRQVSSIPGLTEQISMFEHYALMPAGSSGLAIFDLSDPSQPQHVDTIRAPGKIWSATTLPGGLVLSADDAAILSAFDLAPQ